MDLGQDIIYRGFTLNDADIEDNITGGGGDASGIEGCVVDSVDFADVDVVQWSEKRSQADGNDAGDPFLGVRRIRMAGTLYSRSRLTLFDSLQDLRAALNPILAAREEPLDRGYRPLYFSYPTNRNSDYPSGAIPLQVKALPRGMQHIIQSDTLGGGDLDSLAISWQASFICKDPGIYSADPVDVTFNEATNVEQTGTGQNAGDTITKNGHGFSNGDRVTFRTLTGGSGLSTGVTYYVVNKATNTFQVSLTSGGAAVAITADYSTVVFVRSTTVSGTWSNRGNYLGKFNALIVVGAGAGTISATVGDSSFTVTVPASTGNRTIRIKDDKVITFEESSEVPQMSAIAFNTDTTWPLIDPGDTPYSITFHGMGGLQAGGHMWFYEQYA